MCKFAYCCLVSCKTCIEKKRFLSISCFLSFSFVVNERSFLLIAKIVSGAKFKVRIFFSKWNALEKS